MSTQSEILKSARSLANLHFSLDFSASEHDMIFRLKEGDPIFFDRKLNDSEIEYVEKHLAKINEIPFHEH